VPTQSPRLGSFENPEPSVREPKAAEIALPELVRHELWERWLALAVLVLTAILYFAKLGARSLWASEYRWAEIAREMLQSHNYFWPTINGRVYFDKPLGSYWLVLAAARITGGVDEAATRIPSAVAGVLAVALLILLVRRLYDLRSGVAAGFILATSFGFVFWSRTGSADIETVAGELGALLVFANHEQQRPGWWVLPMWLIMAFTSLTKGLLGFVLPLIVIGAYSCVVEGWPELQRGSAHGSLHSRIGWLIGQNRWFFNWRTSVAVLMAGVIYLAPFAISYASTGSSAGMYMVYRENLERYFAPFDHRGPVYLYAYVIFGLMAPWSPFLPAAVIYAHGRSAPSSTSLRSDRFVLAFFWTTFIFFTLSGSRRNYYILPILPPASILVARVLVLAEKELTRPIEFTLNVAVAVVFSTLAFSIVFLLPPRVLLPPPYSFLPSLPRPWIFLACWIVSLSAAGYAIFRYSSKRIILSVSVLAYLMSSYVFLFAMPAGERWRSEKSFAHAVRRLIEENPVVLASFKTQPPVFYLGLAQPVLEYDNLADLQSAVRSGRIKWIILRQRDVATLDLPASRLIFEPTYPWDSAKHQLDALTLMKVRDQAGS
jgi:4-amino-4-deoxy-L-arabinose transferase-like glycosyltransferase